MKIQKDQLQIGQESPYPYYSLVAIGNAVAILPITPEGDYLLIEEYRHPTGKSLLGCPCGFIDSGEDPLQASQRELLEETGFKANSYEIMGSAYPYSGFSTQKTIYIRALGVYPAASPNLEKSEVIRSFVISPEELTKSILSGEEIDGTLCTALFFSSMRPVANT